MDRRRFLAGTAVLAFLPFDRAAATPDSMAEAIRKVVGDAVVREERVKLDMPPLIENGNTVPLTVSVESPMTDGDYVKAIHVFNEKNPQPNVLSARLSPRTGKAMVGTRIKLGDSQKIVAIAETSDGRFWSASADVIVTLAACLEEAT
ncbi:MAG: SoxY-related AACIE arm protein [Proteobacteria bacterium]|nr:SoxY-related AACIE arm protein [Pseudomonadota bacterium]